MTLVLPLYHINSVINSFTYNELDIEISGTGLSDTQKSLISRYKTIQWLQQLR
ncbi:hypothetical protein Ppb6_00541 [Photorhabdus australis subsp. thailandensis]|uniref:Uncharacterized protein n=1 Tax=Photorhabdus australis subsp. thailandensis TaxID=2805096 RepID=A0A1C0U8G7_9GAMM|nr:hypothetical protein Ppb6_00541 [Photorhabdus australis subsp. thailandensis]